MSALIERHRPASPPVAFRHPVVEPIPALADDELDDEYDFSVSDEVSLRVMGWVARHVEIACEELQRQGAGDGAALVVDATAMSAAEEGDEGDDEDDGDEEIVGSADADAETDSDTDVDAETEADAVEEFSEEADDAHS